MPRRDQPARDVCDTCGRGTRADRLGPGRLCFTCQLDVAATLPGPLAERARRIAIAAHYRRETASAAPRLICPSCRAERVTWEPDDPRCAYCQVKAEVAKLAAS